MIATTTRRVVGWLAWAGVGALLVAAGYHFEHVNHTTVALVLVLVILVISTRWSLQKALVASAAAAVGFYYSLHPKLFGFNQPEYWVALVTFLATALTTSLLATRVRRHAADAERRRAEMERLYALSRAILGASISKAHSQEVVDRMVSILGLSGAALLYLETSTRYGAGPRGHLVTNEQLRHAAYQERISFDGGHSAGQEVRRLGSGPARHAVEGASFIPLHSEGKVVGCLGLRGARLSEAVLSALASLVEADLERAKAAEKSAQAEALRQSEELKSTVMDAVAHDFRTPLTSIKAAVTALLGDATAERSEQNELLTVIDEEADRLNLLVGQAIGVSKLGDAMLQLRRRPVRLQDLFSEVLEELGSSAETRCLQVTLPDSLPLAEVDARLMKQVLKQLLDNARKYSAPHSPIALAASLVDGNIVVHVQDQGPGIAADEHGLIFRKYYRGSHAAGGVTGTGMGLTIAKSIIEAHGGRIWVESSPGQGSIFHFSLPVFEGEGN